MKTDAMKHQITGLARSEGKRNFAYLMEQGTGKTWITLADTERCFYGNKIDALLVFAPNGVHTNWIRREAPQHLSAPFIAYAWNGPIKTKKQKAAWAELFRDFSLSEAPPLRIFTINFEAVNTKAGYDAVAEFIRCFRVMAVVDESTRIANPEAKRTKKIIELGREATARRILSGTPLKKDPTDLYSQFDFLKSGLLGTTSYRAFVSEYSVLLDSDDPQMRGIMRRVMEGRKNWKDQKKAREMIPQVVKTDDSGNKMFRNLDQLSDMIRPHSYRVRKEDCLDLPPKIYQTVFFELTPELRRVYDRLRDEYEYLKKKYIENYVTDHPEVDYGDAVEYFETHCFEGIACQVKMKQVVSGFINVEGEPVLIDPENNPRMNLFKEYVEGIDGQMIVWCLYEVEILQVAEALRSMGLRVATYYGKTKKGETREKIIDDFQAGRLDAIVGHAAAMGIGLTLTAATTSLYYSCDRNNELRLQSEDRNHRIGTVKSPVYVDFIAEDTIDEDDMKGRAFKSELANMVIDRKGRED
ncbi:DNA helicase [Burkholderia phage Maja]|uniref:DNA helicase n=1 Tax=Burkholderia phage Maja TaxID=2767571 RepID=A0A7S6R777_9CAUD|nr:DNA helicase [Burkholderia phage Maja]